MKKHILLIAVATYSDLEIYLLEIGNGKLVVLY